MVLRLGGLYPFGYVGYMASIHFPGLQTAFWLAKPHPSVLKYVKVLAKLYLRFLQKLDATIPLSLYPNNLGLRHLPGKVVNGKVGKVINSEMVVRTL